MDFLNSEDLLPPDGSMSIGYDPFKKTKPIEYFKAKRKAVQNNKIATAQKEAQDAYDQIIAEGNTQIGEYDNQIQGLRGQQPGLLMQGAIPQRTAATPSLGESLAQGIAGLFQRGQANNVNNAVAQSSQRRAQEQDQYNAAVYNQGENNKQAQFKMLDQQISDILRQRGETANDVSNARMGQARDKYALDRTEATIQGAIDRNNATIDNRYNTTLLNNQTKQSIADMKTPEGKYQRAIQMGMDPEEAMQNYQAETGKIRIKQEIDARKATSYENNLKSMAEYRIGQLNLGKERNKISREAIAAAFQRAKLAADTRIQTTGMMVDAAGQRQYLGQEFDRELYNMGLKMPQGWNYESPEQKIIHDNMDHLYKALEGYQDDDLKYGTTDNAEKIKTVQKQIDDLEQTYLKAGVKRPLAPAPAGGK